MLKFSFLAAITLLTIITSLFLNAKPLEVRSPSNIIDSAPEKDWRIPSQENLLYMELENGRVILELSPEFAPNHVQNIKTLVREGFYNGLSFYRVIDGFVAQGGGYGKQRKINKGKKEVNAEFTLPIDNSFTFTPLPDNDGFAAHTGYKHGFPISLDNTKSKAWITHCTGVLAMARSNNIHSGGTEIYITLNNQRYLDNNITVFGRVLMGMEYLQQLLRTEGPEGKRNIGDKNLIKSISVAADILEQDRVGIKVMRNDTMSFKELIQSRRNRPGDWFVNTPNYVDVCSMTTPVQLVKKNNTP